MGDRQADRLGGLEVEYQVELGRLLDGEFRRLGALEDSVDVARGLAIEVRYVRAIRDETPAATSSRASYISGMRNRFDASMIAARSS